MAEGLFWFAFSVIVYVYAGYPFTIMLLSFIFQRHLERREIEPSVTFLVTAYNEEKDIRQKLENTLSLDYPRDKLEIIVASDGSTDETDEIVREFSERGVVLHRVEGRVGKTETQNQAVKVAKGAIIVFSDATTQYNKDGIRMMMRNYSDSSVGAVSGRYEYLNPTGGTVGLGTVLFWKYENYIKTRQTRIRTISGCCGCIYSVRRDLYESLPGDIISDLVEPLKILEKGYRIVFEPRAVAYELVEEKPEEEFSMRVRVITRGMNGLGYMRGLLNPLRYPFVAFQLLSHKILRWMIPVLLIVLLVSNVFLMDLAMYRWTLLGQTMFYLSALFAYILERRGKKIRVLFLPLYFCVVNLASFLAFLNVIKGKKMTTWETVRK